MNSAADHADAYGWKQVLARRILLALVIGGLPAVVASSYDAAEAGFAWMIPFYVIAYTAGVAFVLWRRAPYTLQAGTIIGLLYVLTTLDFVQEGRTGGGCAFFLSIFFLVGLFWGRREGFVAIVAATLTMVAMAIAFTNGWLQLSEGAYSPSLVSWLSTTAIVVMLGLLTVMSLDFVIPRLVAALQQSQYLTGELRTQQAALETRLAEERTTVQQYLAHMDRLAVGDLTAQLTVADTKLDDPLALLGRRLGETTESLRQMTARIDDVAGSLGAAAAEIIAATTEQAVGAEEQASAIAQTSTTIDEVRAIAEQTAEQAQGVADVAERLATVSTSGQQAVVDSLGGMEEVKRKVEAIATNILALSEQAQTIGLITTAVNDLTSQSNMLALNAAVEAARAGETGKGFAVVASEVRALAGQSRKATAQVEETLTEIQRAVNTAVMLTEEGLKGASAGVHMAGDAGESIQRLAEGVTGAVQAAAQIAAAASQQMAGMGQVALSMENIRQVTEQTAANAGRAERAAHDLGRLADRLAETVAQYRL